MRLPVESGTTRLRGFGYAEFDSVNDLMEALTLAGEVSRFGRCSFQLLVVALSCSTMYI